MIINIIIFVSGLIVGALVTRKHTAKVNMLVEEAKELAAKAQEELAELKAKQKKPATKRGRKPTTKSKK